MTLSHQTACRRRSTHIPADEESSPQIYNCICPVGRDIITNWGIGLAHANTQHGPISRRGEGGRVVVCWLLAGRLSIIHVLDNTWSEGVRWVGIEGDWRERKIVPRDACIATQIHAHWHITCLCTGKHLLKGGPPILDLG